MEELDCLVQGTQSPTAVLPVHKRPGPDACSTAAQGVQLQGAIKQQLLTERAVD